MTGTASAPPPGAGPGCPVGPGAAPGPRARAWPTLQLYQTCEPDRPSEPGKPFAHIACAGSSSAKMCDLTATAEARALAHDDARPVLFMATITAPPLCLAPPSSAPSPEVKASLVGSSSPSPAPAKTPRADSGTLARLSPASAGPSLPAADVCCLEGCGLGWRVRPPLRRRGPWEVLAQRMRLSVEALGGARIEKVYTLLDLHELAPRTSYEVCVGDLHAGDECHVPVLVSLPALAVPVPCVQVVRFSLTYVDALRIDTKSTELCTTIVRAAVRARPRRAARAPAPRAPRAHPSRLPRQAESVPRAPPPPPVSIDRERNRVLVAEALHRAAAAANAGSLDGACAQLAEAETLLACAASMRARDSLCLALHDVLAAATQRLDAAIADVKGRSAAALLDKLPLLPAARSSRTPSSTPSSAARAPRAGSAQAAHLLRHAALRLARRRHLRRRAASRPARAARSAAGPSSEALARRASRRRRVEPSDRAPGARTPRGAAAAAAAAATRPARWPRRLPLREPPTGADRGVGPRRLRRPGQDGAQSDAHARAAAGALPGKPLRLLGTVGAMATRRGSGGRVSPALRGRPRLAHPVLVPLHAPPMAMASARPPRLRRCVVGDAGGGARRRPPPPPPSSPARPAQGSLETWLCRLLRSPVRPLPLPDDLIVHIFSFLPPSVLFHDSLPLNQLVVDKNTTVRGHHTTISSALRVAQPGDRLLIRPGVYRESLRIDVPVMIVGCPGGGGGNGGGGGGGVTITSSRNHTVQSTAPFARLEGVTLRQTGSSGRSCLLTSRGRLEVSDCDISSASGLCVEVTDTAAPIVRHSRIHGGAAAGLWFRAAGCGLVEGNEIWGNGWSGVQISEEANPTLLRNFIHDNKSAGIISFNSGKGVARHNDITHNGKGGVQVRSRACPELVRNRIFSERSFGVWVYEHGLGRFEDNDIVNNAWSGFQVEEGSAPIVVGNRLRGNRSAGIVVYNRGSGTYEWNDISCNGRCGVQIKSGSSPYFRHNKIHHEKQAGVLTAEDGTGVLEDNDIFDNAWSGVQTEGPSNPLLRHNRIHHNGGAGFIAYQNGSGLLEANNIYGNKKYGVQSKTGGHPTVRANRIHDKVYGIYLTESGGGIYEDNRIHNIRGSGIFVSADCSPVLANNHGTV